ncbi:MAG: hypothetical protein GY937_28660 [bacterium]|nr:hypothetical protein [bacterium]
MRARSRTDGAVPRVAATSQMVAARRAKAAALRRVRTAAMSAAADSAFTERARRAAYEASRHGSDCDDSRPDVYPGATEVCDAVDNDCDGEVDEGQTILRYVDADGDLHGAPGSGMEVCPDDIRRAQEDGEWLSEVGNDCDDTDPDRWHDCN